MISGGQEGGGGGVRLLIVPYYVKSEKGGRISSVRQIITLKFVSLTLYS